MVGGGVALYVLLMPIGIHQQSLQLQLTAATWGTGQSWLRKGCSLEEWGILVILFVVVVVVVQHCLL